MSDVFISYAAEDSIRAETLARRLAAHGLRVYFDKWCILPGDLVVHELEAAIRASRNGIAIFSPAAESSRRVLEEYAALYRAAARRGLRFIPVLFGGVRPPPFAATRVWRDFSRLDESGYEARVAELAAVISGRRYLGARAEADNFGAALVEPPRPISEPDRHAVVVCHVPADQDYARALTATLEAAGLPVWSLRDLRPGDSYSWSIRQQLQYAIAIVVLMSPESQNSPDITLMILAGLTHDRPFMPVLLAGERNFHLANTWYLDARDGRLPGRTELEMLHALQRADAAGTPIDPIAVLPAPSPRPAVAAVRVPAGASLERLDGYLARHELTYADLLTTTLLLEAAGRLDEGWLRRADDVQLPLDLLAAVAQLWARHTYDRQGFARQQSVAPIDGERHADFVSLSVAYGWRDSRRDDVPQDYREFAARAGSGARAGFFPTLRNPQHEHYQDWYARWTATTVAVHLRLREWRRQS